MEQDAFEVVLPNGEVRKLVPVQFLQVDNRILGLFQRLATAKASLAKSDAIYVAEVEVGKGIRLKNLELISKEDRWLESRTSALIRLPSGEVLISANFKLYRYETFNPPRLQISN